VIEEDEEANLPTTAREDGVKKSQMTDLKVKRGANDSYVFQLTMHSPVLLTLALLGCIPIVGYLFVLFRRRFAFEQSKKGSNQEPKEEKEEMLEVKSHMRKCD